MTNGPIPEGVYYSAEADNFYSVDRRRGMGHSFWRQWRKRRAEFPGPPSDADAEIDYTDQRNLG